MLRTLVIIAALIIIIFALAFIIKRKNSKKQ